MARLMKNAPLPSQRPNATRQTRPLSSQHNGETKVLRRRLKAMHTRSRELRVITGNLPAAQQRADDGEVQIVSGSDVRYLQHDEHGRG